MTIRHLNNSYLEQVESYLCSYASTSMFVRSNMRLVGLEYKEDDFHGDYYGVFNNNDELTGVIAHYWNGNIMMQASHDDDLVNLTLTLCSNTERGIEGVLGDARQCNIVMQTLAIPEELYAINRSEGLYSIELSNLIMPANFNFDNAHMVEAAEVDIPTLRNWIKAYEIEALGSEDNEKLNEHVEDRLKRTIKSQDVWALKISGEAVALSGFNARLPDIVQIGPVWTPPEHRNNGYARALVALTLQKADKEGTQKSILFTDNPAAQKAYEAVGFKRTGSFCLALLKDPYRVRS